MKLDRTLIWTFVISGIAVFMTVLDNLVVTTALPSIRADFGASLGDLEWTVNAYTLTFAVLLLTAAAAGDRFGRKRVFLAGLGVFTAASAAAALATSAETLIIARAVQGIGGAIVVPLSLTILAEAAGRERRALALGLWSAIAGLAVAAGPVVGGAVVEGISWEWVFWLNIPFGLLALPIAARYLRDSRGPDRALDLRGAALATAGLFGLVWGLVSGNSDGWTSPTVLAALGGGIAFTIAFFAWQLRSPAPMVPLRLFRDRTFAAANAASALLYFGLFGAVFFLSQYFQTAQGASPLEAGLQILPWTAVPMFSAAIGSVLAEKIGGAPVVSTGLALMGSSLAIFASVAEVGTSYTTFILPLVLGGIGAGLFYGPIANIVLSAVRVEEEGKASGVNNGLRELGGVFGVAVMAAVFAHRGGFESPEVFVDGLRPALWIGAAAVLAGAVAAVAIRHRRAASSGQQAAAGKLAAAGARAG
jgi:EmrB/QacA subfamily drug resistance transporter